jgi:hypothetical protein
LLLLALLCGLAVRQRTPVLCSRARRHALAARAGQCAPTGVEVGVAGNRTRSPRSAELLDCTLCAALFALWSVLSSLPGRQKADRALQPHEARQCAMQWARVAALTARTNSGSETDCKPLCCEVAVAPTTDASFCRRVRPGQVDPDQHALQHAPVRAQGGPTAACRAAKDRCHREHQRR